MDQGRSRATSGQEGEAGQTQWATNGGRNGGFPEDKERGEEHETGQAGQGNAEQRPAHPLPMLMV